MAVLPTRATFLLVVLAFAAVVASRPSSSGHSDDRSLWNDRRLVVEGTPGFSSTDEPGRHLFLAYSIHNLSDQDYLVPDASRLRLMALLSNGLMDGPLSEAVVTLKTPIFIPADRVGTITLTLQIAEADSPELFPSESKYHEALREQTSAFFNDVDKLVLYDEVNHYRIDLPRTAEASPKQDGYRGFYLAEP